MNTETNTQGANGFDGVGGKMSASDTGASVASSGAGLGASGARGAKPVQTPKTDRGGGLIAE